MEKYIVIGLLVMVLISLELFSRKLKSAKIPKMEIYTPSNIYYIDDLRITDESTGLDIVCNNPQEVKDFISETTAEEVQKYLEKDTDLLNKIKKETFRDYLIFCEHCNEPPMMKTIKLIEGCSSIEALQESKKVFSKRMKE